MYILSNGNNYLLLIKNTAMINHYLKIFCLNTNLHPNQFYSRSYITMFDDDIKINAQELRDEIQENLLTMDKERHLFYLDYAIDMIKRSSYYTLSETPISKWLTKYNAKIEDYPYFGTGDLNELLNTMSLFIHRNKLNFDIDELKQITIDFYIYAAHIETNKMVGYLEDLKINSINTIDNADKIKWIGKPAQLGFILGTLADLNYIDAPKLKNGEINYTQFANLLLSVFDIKSTPSSIAKYLNLESEKGQETSRRFKKHAFAIPHKNIVS